MKHFLCWLYIICITFLSCSKDETKVSSFGNGIYVSIPIEFFRSRLMEEAFNKSNTIIYERRDREAAIFIRWESISGEIALKRNDKKLLEYRSPKTNANPCLFNTDGLLGCIEFYNDSEKITINSEINLKNVNIQIDYFDLGLSELYIRESFKSIVNSIHIKPNPQWK